jgi:DNA-binding protein YbaB
MFDKLKDIIELKKKMAEVKNRLDAMVIKTQSPKKYFEITLNGSQEVKEVKVLQKLDGVDEAVIEREIREIINKSVRDSQMLAARAMSDVSGGLA